MRRKQVAVRIVLKEHGNILGLFAVPFDVLLVRIIKVSSCKNAREQLALFFSFLLLEHTVLSVVTALVQRKMRTCKPGYSHLPTLADLDLSSPKYAASDSSNGMATSPAADAFAPTPAHDLNLPTFLTMESDDSYTTDGTSDSPHQDRPKLGCNTSVCSVLFPLSSGAVLILVAFIFNEEDYFNLGHTIDSKYMFVTTSTLWIFLSFGCALMIGSLWRILQYCPLSDCLQCVQRVPSINIAAMMLLICLSTLSVIGLVDHSPMSIHYPWWLSAAMLFIAVCCLLFVCCINTKSAATRRRKKHDLMNHYFDKMVAEEGENGDFAKKEHRDKLPDYITKRDPPIHPYDRSTLSFLWHTFTHYHMFAVIRLGTRKVLQSYHCYYAPKADDIEYRFNEFFKENERQQNEHGKGIHFIFRH